MKNIDKIERRVRALLAQAADQDGTPEGDAFQARAFELMARYGVDQAQLGDDDTDEMGKRVIELAGAYTPSQFELAGYIGRALHCHIEGRGNGRKVLRVVFYGKTRHIERAAMLFSILNPQMATGAENLPKVPGVARAVQKRSWMEGFAIGVARRLQSAEEDATEAAGQAVAVLDDRQAAENFARQESGPARTLRSRATRDRRAMSDGIAAADDMDLGQERIGGRIAITA